LKRKKVILARERIIIKEGRKGGKEIKTVYSILFVFVSSFNFINNKKRFAFLKGGFHLFVRF